ncbi:hypothetical protein M405DRAFT_806081 [Rhizopogon salebrosus TDB-379]|nr:hypothetical protein M405DRAFT_806081 [Rhizopogon salebrosus TDB-379]
MPLVISSSCFLCCAVLVVLVAASRGQRGSTALVQTHGRCVDLVLRMLKSLSFTPAQHA